MADPDLLEKSLALQTSDQPGMQLVTHPLDPSNYLEWSTAMIIALQAKDKLALIDSRLQEPTRGIAHYEKWQKTDSMVRSWILNSMSKELSSAFLYTPSARKLWLEVKERYGGSNDPLLYQIKRDITSITQGDLSIVEYFTKLKKLWDELGCLRPTPLCTCHAANLINENEGANSLMEFLMGLND